MKKGKYGLILLFTILFAGWAPHAAAIHNVSFDPRTISQSLDDFVFYINQERQLQGLNALLLDPILSQVAGAHCQKMIAAEQLAHNFSAYPFVDERLASAGLYFSSCGENIARSSTPVVKVIHDSFMSSGEHRANVLNPDYTAIGLAIVHAADSSYYITQEFAALFIPQKSEVIEADLNKQLTRCWLKKEDLPFRANEFRNKALAVVNDWFFQQHPLGTISTAELGYNLVFVYASPQEDKLLATICKAVSNLEIMRYTLAVVFGRQPKSPGGAYALALLTFPKFKDSAKSTAQKIVMVWQGIVAMCNQQMRKPFYLDAALCEIAAAALRQNNYFWPPDTSATIYSTADLSKIPAYCAELIQSETHYQKIGIGIQCPTNKGSSANEYTVVLLLAK